MLGSIAAAIAGTTGMLERSGGHHDLVSMEGVTVGVDAEPGTVMSHPGDLGVVPDRQPERRGVTAEVLRDSVFRGMAVRVAGKGQAGQARVAGRGEQRQRVPARPPDVPGFRAGIHDQERATALLQLPSDRQTGLPGPDHDGIEG